MKAYSQDLRLRIMSCKKDGLKVSELSKLFKVGKDAIYRWIKRDIETGNYSSRQHLNKGPAFKFTDKQAILRFILINPDADGIAIRDGVAPSLAMSTFYDTLRRMDITLKKKEPKYIERKDAERKEFAQEIEGIAPEKLIFVDEVGHDNNMVTTRGWSEKGKRSYAEQLGHKTLRLSIVAGYNRMTKEIIAPFEYKGYTDTHLFNGWFEQQLIPALVPGDVVILDNARFHRDPDLIEIAAEKQIRIIYLPAYSPDLNPIEKFWANLKRNIRKIIKTCKTLQEAITLAFKLTSSC